jgi:hypothetical protein
MEAKGIEHPSNSSLISPLHESRAQNPAHVVHNTPNLWSLSRLGLRFQMRGGVKFLAWQGEPMEHLFDTGVAQKYGVDAAILIRHLQFWLLKNKADKRHQHDGRTWTYGSVRSFAKIFPYWTSKHISRLLNVLVDKGILLKANHNQTTYYRTLWYAFADEETFLLSQNPISQKGKMDLPKTAKQ